MKDHLDSDLSPGYENLVEVQGCCEGDIKSPLLWKVRGRRSHRRWRNNRAAGNENLVEVQGCREGDIMLPLEWKGRGRRSQRRWRNN